MTWCHFFCVFLAARTKGKNLLWQALSCSMSLQMFDSAPWIWRFNLKNHISDHVMQLMSLLGKQGSHILLDCEQSLFSSKIFGKERKTSERACMILCVNYVLCVLPQGFSSKRETISVANHAMSSSVWN